MLEPVDHRQYVWTIPKVLRPTFRRDRLLATNYPEDWQYYTLCHPVANYQNFTWKELVEERNRFDDRFYSYPKIFRRGLRMASRNWREPRKVFVGLIMNLTYRYNHLRDRGAVRTASPRGSWPFLHRLLRHWSPHPVK